MTHQDHRMICPSCQSDRFDYDKFEDMYRCVGCERFWYPAELNVAENHDAGIWKLQAEKTK